MTLERLIFNRVEGGNEVTDVDGEQRRRAERARRIALFRNELVQEVIDPALSSRQRGRLVRDLAGKVHTGPFGAPVRVSAPTLNRWCRWWRAGGFEALVPTPARVEPRTPAEVLAMAAGLKRENPDRTAAQVVRILRAQSGWAPSERTLQRHFRHLELHRDVPANSSVFGRFEADRCNELWVGDVLHGPAITGRKTYLFAFLDDRSRAVMAARFGFAEDAVRLAAALRPALASRGVPESIYVDNGSSFVDSWLLRACATLGIKLVHSRPGQPEGRGKIERWFRTVRDQFLVEITDQVDELLIGRKVELVFDPFDLTDIEVRYRGHSHGKAVAFRIGRHSHPKARPEHPDLDTPPTTGIDYLRLVDADHTQQLESRINYTALFGDTDNGQEADR